MAEKKKVHYVDNKKFLAAIVERKVLLKEAEEEGATDKMWSDPRAIATKNWLDTESCDLVLAYLPKELNDNRPS